MNKFTHLHLHTQYSILDGAADIPTLIKKTKELGMDSVAITDHGNMFGAKLFHKTAKKEGIKPILGCEVYVAENRMEDKTPETGKKRYHLVLLAKNKKGYHNLIKLVSKGWTEGFYHKPRIDKDILRQCSEGIICTTACLGGEVPQAIMKHIQLRDSGEVTPEEMEKAIAEATPVIKEFQSMFGDDFYLEVQRAKTGSLEMDRKVYFHQVQVNTVMAELSARTGTKIIATNDVHFINAEDADAHDRLICLNTGKDLDDPNRMRYTKQEYLKSADDMYRIFADMPQACANTQEIAGKVELYELDSLPVMPDFPLPVGFASEAEYLRHITYQGAEMRWKEAFSGEIKERIDFELDTIIGMGFPGYFLIVWDFIKAAREMGVAVGPGRGSAAGSAVAYALRITEIDPVKYQLLFERFLNPDRVSMPDIDIDFDEDGREHVLQWVVDKYGAKRVAHIVTFGSMAPKMSIKDVARVQKLELSEANRLAKLIPEKPGTTFKSALIDNPELLAAVNSPNELIASTMRYAQVLEGSVRQTGVHACGVIICRDDLEEHIPICINKDAKLVVTQYDGKHVEDVGMLKMDFLGLKTLSIIKDAVRYAKISKGADIDIDNIHLDDAETFELFSRGETTGLFQFESPGMKKHLKALKPNRFEDLIAMNALYRPGPMEYIPSFINRKHGTEPIAYDLPEMEEFLQDTYGITVYQEQVMLLSQKLGGFTKGMADSLRKAMGKKIKSVMDELKAKFKEGCLAKGYPDKTVEKIWTDWEAFAQYAFNKSHSTCYAYIAYQTGYLKAHFPSEFMAAVLSRNLSNIDKITVFMEECKRMKLSVKVPDVNESIIEFSVNKKGDIRFGLGAIKGVGEAASQAIISEREKNGHYADIFDFVARIPLRTVNKKNLESLALSGAFDSFGLERHLYMSEDNQGQNFIETLMKYGNSLQGASTAPSLFGDDAGFSVPKPQPPFSAKWPRLRTLAEEKALIGMYLSSHPLDDYKMVIKHFCNKKLTELDDLRMLKGKELTVAGMVTATKQATAKNGKNYGILTLEDYDGSYEFPLFGRDYNDFCMYLTEGSNYCITATVEPKWGGSDDLMLKIKTIEQLSEVSRKINNISLKISVQDLTPELISTLKELSVPAGEPGLALKFLVHNPNDKLWVEMYSKNCKLPTDPEVISFLEETEELEFKLS
jgi:DNA polymerase III subunit alpha